MTFFASAAAAQSLPDPENSMVFARDPHAAVQQLAGRGVELPGGLVAARAFDAAGNEIVWKEARRSTDPLGNVHVFYRQHVGDVELFGSEVGVHSDRSGRFLYLGGTQFENVVITNAPKFNRIEAVNRAGEKLRIFRGERLERQALSMTEVVAHRAGQTKLRLVQTGGEFRYAYFSFASDEQGGYHSVILDAENARLLGTGEANPGSNCAPQNRNISVNAVGIPIRPGVANRVLKASPSTDRPAPYTYDGFFLTPSSTTQPSQSVYQETTHPAWRCNVYVPVSYTLFPLETDAYGVPTYGDIGVPDAFLGKVAGDALYHTQQTMRAFTTHGRKSWNGSNGEAKIVIESSLRAADQAGFIRNSPDQRSPGDAVVVGPASMFYNAAAALDLIAHEWGHGLIFDEVGLPYVSQSDEIVHEGYADVIGHIVEKRRQPAGTGLEQSSDWTIAEDVAVSGYDRGALDDGESPGHAWVGPNGSKMVDQKIHMEDNSGDATPHATGNVLSMVLRLLTEGGRNPICNRAPGNWSACFDIPHTNKNERVVVTALGFDKASRIMFNAAYEMPSTVTLNNMATYVAAAAFNLYGSCSYNGQNAAIEQKAVTDAFEAVGLPGSNQVFVCTP